VFELTEFDLHITELSDFSDLLDSKGKPALIEHISRYDSDLGRVLMRSTSTTYTPTDQMAASNHAELTPSDATFPTITRIDILLLPISWAHKRGVAVLCHHISNTLADNYDIVFKMRQLGNAKTSCEIGALRKVHNDLRGSRQRSPSHTADDTDKTRYQRAYALDEALSSLFELFFDASTTTLRI